MGVKTFLMAVEKGNFDSKTHAQTVFFDEAAKRWKVFTVGPSFCGQKALDDWLRSQPSISNISIHPVGLTQEVLDKEALEKFSRRAPGYGYWKVFKLACVESFPTFFPELRAYLTQRECASPKEYLCTDGSLAVLSSQALIKRKLKDLGLAHSLLLPDQLEQLVQSE